MQSVAVATPGDPQPPIGARVEREGDRRKHADREEPRHGVAVAERELERPVDLEDAVRSAVEEQVARP